MEHAPLNLPYCKLVKLVPSFVEVETVLEITVCHRTPTNFTL